jgi:hypothetical protein
MIDRIHTLGSSLAPAVARAAAAALWSWMMFLEALAESGDEELRPSYRTYVGLHTPDTDPASIRIDAAPHVVEIPRGRSTFTRPQAPRRPRRAATSGVGDL